MASSSSVTAPNSSENSDNISNQSSNINDESKKDLPISSTIKEETTEYASFEVKTQSTIEQQNDLSPNVIQKLSHTPLAASFISATEPPALFAIRSRRNVVCARPFEDVNMGSSDADTSSGTVTKPNDNKSSSTSKHA